MTPPVRVDRMLRGMDRELYEKAKRSAHGRGITVAEYLGRLQALHEWILASDEARALDQFGLGRVGG